MDQISSFGALNFCWVEYNIILLGIIINFHALYILYYNIIIIRSYLPTRFVHIILYSRCSLVFRSKPKIVNTSSVRYLKNVGISNIFICEARYYYNGTRDYLRTQIASCRSYHKIVSTWSQLEFIHQFPEVVITSGKCTINLKPIHFAFTAKFKYRCS